MTDPKRIHRYRHVAGKRLIEVRVKSPLQLFDSRDPAPFRERDLDDDFVEYILASASEFSLSSPPKIVIYIQEPETRDLPAESIRVAIISYLEYRIDLQRSDLKSFIKRAQLYMIVGLVILATCLSTAQNLKIPTPPGSLGILREGIVIFGWVSIWKPIELLLFDWYPLYEKLRFYKKLLSTEIEIVFSSEAQDKLL